MGNMITDKDLAYYLLASLPLNKYEVLITSLYLHGEDNLEFDRLKYLLLQSSDHETFNDFTGKDGKASFSKSNGTTTSGFLESE